MQSQEKLHFTKLSLDQLNTIFAQKVAGTGSRKIAADVLGSRSKKSTINYLYNSMLKGCLSYANEGGVWQMWSYKQNHNVVDVKFGVHKPKILVLDIETAPMKAYLWSMWQQGVGLNQIANEWFIMSFAAKWLGDSEDSIIYQDMRGKMHTEDDTELLDTLWELLDEADFLLTQNGVKFDDKKIKARMILNGYQPPSSYRHIDTLQIAKREFGFTSNKLEWMTDKLCHKYKKQKHGQFAGFELWKECIAENPEAWAECENYNKYDILSLEELYSIVAPWDRRHPNFNLYHSDEHRVCRCGSVNLKKTGYAYTNLSKFQRYKCLDCGAEQRDRVNLLSKDKRKTLMSNIA